DRIPITDQDAQRSLRSGGWNPYGNLAHQALAAIRTNHGFHHNLIAGTSFGHVRARGFQASRAAFADKIEIELHALNVGNVESIAIDASKAVAGCPLSCGANMFRSVTSGYPFTLSTPFMRYVISSPYSLVPCSALNTVAIMASGLSRALLRIS